MNHKEQMKSAQDKLQQIDHILTWGEIDTATRERLTDQYNALEMCFARVIRANHMLNMELAAAAKTISAVPVTA